MELEYGELSGLLQSCFSATDLTPGSKNRANDRVCVQPIIAQDSYSKFVDRLLVWFVRNERPFPWRESRDPYTIAVAEILLQKTSATNVLLVYGEFLQRFPSVRVLAGDSPEAAANVIRPLGLPRRALLLVETARTIMSAWGGQFPREVNDLRNLPGIGPYCAAAVSALAFDQPVAMIDINVMRIIERVFSIPYTRRNGPSLQVRRFVANLLPSQREREFDLALVDFGALICRKRDPQCNICPLADICHYRQTLVQGPGATPGPDNGC